MKQAGQGSPVTLEPQSRTPSPRTLMRSVCLSQRKADPPHSQHSEECHEPPLPYCGRAVSHGAAGGLLRSARYFGPKAAPSGTSSSDIMISLGNKASTDLARHDGRTQCEACPLLSTNCC